MSCLYAKNSKIIIRLVDFGLPCPWMTSCDLVLNFSFSQVHQNREQVHGRHQSRTDHQLERAV